MLARRWSFQKTASDNREPLKERSAQLAQEGRKMVDKLSAAKASRQKRWQR